MQESTIVAAGKNAAMASCVHACLCFGSLPPAEPSRAAGKQALGLEDGRLSDHYCHFAGVGRHSDPEVGPVLHEAIHKLLNDELKLATNIPRPRRRQPAQSSQYRRSASSNGAGQAMHSSGTHNSQQNQQSSAERDAGGRGEALSEEYELLSRVEGASRGGERSGSRSNADSSRGRGAAMADAGSLIIRRDTLAEWLASRKGLLKSDLLR